MSEEYLVVLDFPGIKKYVFGTDRMVEIRGASALLDWLNRKKAPEFVAKAFSGNSSECVFAGGGAAQFVIKAPPEKIEKVFYGLKADIFNETGGSLNLVWGKALIQDTYKSALQQAFLELEKSKRQNSFLLSESTHTGFIRECQSCSGMGVKVAVYGQEKRILCESCAKKEEMGKRKGLWKEFGEFLNKKGIAPNVAMDLRPDNFDMIGAGCRSKPGFTALVYGDGNSMGEIVKKIDNKKRFIKFSSAVDESIREACHEALWETCKSVGLKTEDGNAEDKIPASILLLGGDDVMVYLAADTALPFAIKVAKLFEQKSYKKLVTDNSDTFFKDNFGDKGLTLSLGIAYGRSHTPISIMVDQAEELLQSAKRKGFAKGGSTPCIDFHLTSRYNSISISDSRKKHLESLSLRGDKIKLYMAPYSLSEAEDLYEHAKMLKASGLSKSKLHQLAGAPFKGKVEGAVEALTAYGRIGKDKQKEAVFNVLEQFGCTPLIPWKKENDKEIKTVIVDLAEIAEFTTIE